MKKIVLTIAAVFAFGFANAQEEPKTFGFTKGNILLEGNIGYNSTNDKNTEEKTNSFNFNPKAGYFISDDFAIGLELGFGSAKEEVAGTEVFKGNAFGVGVFGRYYFLDLGARFKTYAEAGFGFLSGKDESGSFEAKYTGFGFNAGLGINYFVTENFAINFGLTDVLSYNSFKYKDAEAVSEFNANINVFNNFFESARFGLTYKF